MIKKEKIKRQIVTVGPNVFIFQSLTELKREISKIFHIIFNTETYTF